jgi:DNA-binding HxlR family transcriptional regulator
VIEILSEQDGGDSAMNRSWDSSRNLDGPEADGASYRQGCNGRLGIHVCRQAENELPAQLAISLIQGKWKMRILSQLQHGPIRLSQLRKMFPNASKKMLTQHLREMEEDGLVIRTDLSAKLRHVEYSLEDSLGVAVSHLIGTLAEWGSQYAPTLSQRIPVRDWPEE